ncbi:hypothetical protein [Acidisphaera sp. S103]|uniref:hypothetical protein n=1 Tax=Acidisphaera sp. S103 TaxID=1747223 RepID=UPI00131ECA4C|nr:hypothetical protein [Acidisphaera sp. S103]
MIAFIVTDGSDWRRAMTVQTIVFIVTDGSDWRRAMAAQMIAFIFVTAFLSRR